MFIGLCKGTEKRLRFSIFFCGCKQSKSLHIYYAAKVLKLFYISKYKRIDYRRDRLLPVSSVIVCSL